LHPVKSLEKSLSIVVIDPRTTLVNITVGPTTIPTHNPFTVTIVSTIMRSALIVIVSALAVLHGSFAAVSWNTSWMFPSLGWTPNPTFLSRLISWQLLGLLGVCATVHGLIVSEFRGIRQVSPMELQNIDYGALIGGKPQSDPVS
jgi:hypothetical protein